MSEYVVYINFDQIRMGTEQAVSASLAKCGFTRAVRRGEGSSPLATLLFVGDSSFGENQLCRHLEQTLRLDTMCDIHVIVFPSNKLRTRPALKTPPTNVGLASRSAS